MVAAEFEIRVHFWTAGDRPSDVWDSHRLSPTVTADG